MHVLLYCIEQECVSEFICFITSEASDKCKQEKRKTINGEDLLWAMSTLGFDKYVDPLKIYLSKCTLYCCSMCFACSLLCISVNAAVCRQDSGRCLCCVHTNVYAFLVLAFGV